jgi:hypothetical protein
MEPLQLWLPVLGGSLGYREVRDDVERAYRAWQGETTVWLLPELERQVRWVEGPARHVAIPATHLDRVDVYHIGDSGYVWGPASALRFPTGNVDGLLQAWLHVGRLGGLGFHLAPERIPWRSPRLRDDSLEYVQGTVRLLPGATITLTQLEEQRFTCQWRPQGHAAPVFPDVESSGSYQALEPVPPHGLSLLPEWPAPLQGVASLMSGLDEVCGQGLMAAIARQAHHDPEGALKRARDEAGPYVRMDGSTTEGLRWVLPTAVHLSMLARDNDSTMVARLVAEGAQDRFRFRDPVDAKAVMDRLVPITRAWGMLGLLWALLLEELEAKRLHVCRRCGWILKGKRSKQSCDRKDNPDCYRAWGVERQHLSRERAKHRP